MQHRNKSSGLPTDQPFFIMAMNGKAVLQPVGLMAPAI